MFNLQPFNSPGDCAVSSFRIRSLLLYYWSTFTILLLCLSMMKFNNQIPFFHRSGNYANDSFILVSWWAWPFQFRQPNVRESFYLIFMGCKLCCGKFRFRMMGWQSYKCPSPQLSRLSNCHHEFNSLPSRPIPLNTVRQAEWRLDMWFHGFYLICEHAVIREMLGEEKRCENENDNGKTRKKW